MPTREELHPEPALGAVFIEQMRAVGLGARRELIVLVVLLIAQGFLLGFMLTRPGVVSSFDFEPGAIIPFMIFAAVVPLFVWRAENPERRTYLWSIPMSRRSGHLLRLASGWCLTMLAVGLIALWALVMGLVTDGLIWKRDIGMERSYLAPDASFEVTGGIAHYIYQLPLWLLLAPFVLATILYLVGSVVVLSTNHVLRWALLMGVVIAGVSIAASVGETVERRELQLSLGRQPTHAEVADEDRFLERLLGNQHAYGLGNLVDPEPSRQEVIPGTVRPLSVKRADLSNWLSATALWGGLALLAAYIAASRHRDP